MADEPLLYINVDVVFALNFCMDLLWFWAAGRLAGAKTHFERLLAAAAVGAAAAVWAYFPSGAWIASWPAKILGTLLLLALAYYPCELSSALKLLLTYLLTGSAMAGTALLISSSGINSQPSSLLVAVGAILGLVGGAICLISSGNGTG